MPRGGYRVGAGRPKGAVTKITKEAVIQAKKSGELPHEFLLRVVRGDSVDGEIPTLQMRIAAAIAAAPYFAPKLAATEQRIETNVRAVISGEPLSIEEWSKRYGIEYTPRPSSTNVLAASYTAVGEA